MILGWIGQEKVVTSRKIFLSKETFDEVVVRKSLYWCSRHFNWILSEDAKNWVVKIISGGEADEAIFHRYLNDQVLREKIDRDTAGMRRKIVKKVLSSMSSGV